MPVWEPSIRAAGLGPAEVGSHVPQDRQRDGDAAGSRATSSPRRAARRHHPDPDPVHPERRQHRRPVPRRGPRVLPVRGHGPQPDRVRARRRSTRSAGGSASSARRRESRSPAAAVRPARSRAWRSPDAALVGAAARWSGRSCSAARRVGAEGQRRAPRYIPFPQPADPRARPAAPVRPARARRLVHRAVDRASSSARSAIGSTRSRWPSSCSTRPSRPIAVGGRSSSSRRCRTCCSARSPARLVDRWDHREVMIVSDLLRAGLVLLIPLAAVTNLALAYPLVFLVTTVSIFFRPAKGAILPRIVAAGGPGTRELRALGRRDVRGHRRLRDRRPVRGAARDQLPLAFWVDSVTYVASALLIASISGRAGRAERSPRRSATRWAPPGRERARRAALAASLGRRAPGGLAVPAWRAGAPGEHAPGDRRPVHARDLPRAHAGLRARPVDSIAGRFVEATRRTASSRARSARATSSVGSSSA